MTALPSSIRSALVGHESQSLANFAKIADSMLAVSANETPFAVNAVRQNGPQQSDISTRYRRNAQANYKFAVKPFKPEQRPKICNAHVFYADKARTCRHWCKWPGPKPKFSREPQRLLHRRDHQRLQTTRSRWQAGA